MSSIEKIVGLLECEKPSSECCIGKCPKCGDDEKLKSLLAALFEDNVIDEITYKKWTNTDRS